MLESVGKEILKWGEHNQACDVPLKECRLNAGQAECLLYDWSRDRYANRAWAGNLLASLNAGKLLSGSSFGRIYEADIVFRP